MRRILPAALLLYLLSCFCPNNEVNGYYLVHRGETRPPCLNLDELSERNYELCQGFRVMQALYYGKMKKAYRILTDPRHHNYKWNTKDRFDSTFGYTPMIWAARKNNCTIVKYLLDHGAEVDMESADGHTALYFLTRNRNTDCVKHLLRKGADANIYPRGVGNPPLVDAAMNLDDEIVALLVDNEADPNAMTEGSNYFPLYFASKGGRKETVKKLVDRNAEVDKQTSWNITALIIAASYGHKDIVEYLLNKGADPNHKDYRQNTALHKAAAYGYTQILDLLLSQNNIDINAVDGDGRSALHHSAKEGRKDCCSKLLKKCIDKNLRNKYQETALEEARSTLKALKRRRKTTTAEVKRKTRQEEVISTLKDPSKRSSCK